MDGTHLVSNALSPSYMEDTNFLSNSDNNANPAGAHLLDSFRQFGSMLNGILADSGIDPSVCNFNYDSPSADKHNRWEWDFPEPSEQIQEKSPISFDDMNPSRCLTFDDQAAMTSSPDLTSGFNAFADDAAEPAAGAPRPGAATAEEGDSELTLDESQVAKTLVSLMDAPVSVGFNKKSQKKVSRRAITNMMSTIIKQFCPAVFGGRNSDPPYMSRRTFFSKMMETDKLQAAIATIKGYNIMLLKRLTPEELSTIPKSNKGQIAAKLHQIADLEVKLWTYLLIAFGMGFITDTKDCVYVNWDIDQLRTFMETCLLQKDLDRDAQEKHRPIVRSLLLNACRERSDRPKTFTSLIGTVDEQWTSATATSPRKLLWQLYKETS